MPNIIGIANQIGSSSPFGLGTPGDLTLSLKTNGGSAYTDGAIEFTASDKAYLSIEDAAQTGLDPLAGDYSFSFWVKPTTVSAVTNIIYKLASSSGYQFYSTADGTMAMVHGDGTTASGTSAAGTLTSGSWQNYTVVANRSGNLYVYKNGDTASPIITVNISARTGSINSTSPFYVGGTSGARYNGAMDSLGFWNRALTAGEVASLYNAGSGKIYSNLTTAEKVSLVSWWDFNEESGIRYDTHSTNHLDQTFDNIVDGSTLNGGFETLGGGGADVFGTWNESVSGTSTVNAESVAPNSGTYACRLDVDGSGSDVLVAQTIVVAGHKYKATVYAKASAGTPSIRIGSSTAFAVTTSYVQYTNYFNGDTSFYLRKGTATSVSLFFDDVTLVCTEIPSTAGIATGLSIDGNLCASFNGTTQYLTKSNDAKLQIGGNNDFTVFGWCKRTSNTSTNQVIVSKTLNGTAAGVEYAVDILGANLRFLASDGTTNPVATITAPDVNIWFLFIATYSSSDRKPRISMNLIDGTAGSELGVGGVTTTTGAFEIGRGFASYTYAIPASIDGVGIIKRLLTTEEKTSLYNNGKGLKYSELPASLTSDSTLCFWNLDEYSAGTSNVTRLDSTANDMDLTSAGNTPSAQGVNYFEGTVSKWLDQSGNAAHFIQATQSARLLYLTNQQNGKAALVGDGLTKSIYNASDLIGTGNDTIFAVIKPRGWGGGTLGRILDNSQLLFIVASSGGGCVGMASNGATYALSAGGSIALGTAYVVVVTRSSAGVVNFYINGTLSGTADQASGTPAAGSPTYIGNNAGGIRGFDGSIFEVGVYSKILTASQITKVTNLLRTKYNI